MTNIIPFESKSLPAYLKGVDVASLNADLTAHAGGGFPVMSIKGKSWTISRGGERTTIPNPKDPDSPASSIDVVIIKANKNTSKIFYAKSYEEGVDAKPDCYSADGISPAPDVSSPQSRTCAACPHNQWGSRVTESGKKGKACSDSVRIAIATPDQINEPYLLRVPPASFRALGEYGTLLKNRGVAYSMVVTKLGFEPTVATPQLTFKPVGFLAQAAFEEAQAMATSDIVAQILGIAPVVEPFESPAPVAAPKAKPASSEVTAEEVVSAIQKTSKKAVSAPAPAPVAEEEVEVDIGDVTFDD